jgi:hypothetical protein
MARTKAQLKKLHQELWQWLADNPRLSKDDWPSWDYNGGKQKQIPNACFACEAAGFKYIDEPLCDKCPCDWNAITCTDKGSPYTAWGSSHGVKRTKYALQVKKAWR